MNLLSYIAPGDAHTALSDGTFYTETVNGVKLVDWVTTSDRGRTRRRRALHGLHNGLSSFDHVRSSNLDTARSRPSEPSGVGLDGAR